MTLLTTMRSTELGMVPNDWRVETLSNLGGVVTSGSRGWAKYYAEHGDLFVRITNLRRSNIHLDLGSCRYVRVPADNAEVQRTRLTLDDLLVSITADIGIVGYVDAQLPSPAYINQHIARVRFGRATVSGQFVAYYLSSWGPQRTFVGSTDTGAKAGMNLTTVGALKTVVPPLAEQVRIVEALADVDMLIATLERMLAKKRAIKQGMMQQLLTGRTRLAGFSVPWKTFRLVDLISIKNGQVDPRRHEYRDLPLIAPDHVESATGRLMEVKSARAQRAISGKYLVAPGDIIYSKIRPYLQKAVRVDFSALCSADMYPFTPKAGTDGAFILHVLLSEYFTNFAVGVSARSGIPKINRAELAEFSLTVPDFSEQQAISAALNQAGDQIVALESLLDKIRAVKQGMMQQLLTGRTRLPTPEAA